MCGSREFFFQTLALFTFFAPANEALWVVYPTDASDRKGIFRNVKSLTDDDGQGPLL